MVSDEHDEIPIQIVSSSGGETPTQQSSGQHLSEHIDGLEKPASEQGEESVDEVEGVANKGSPEPGQEEVVSEEDEQTHMTEDKLTGMN